ncbi:MAG: hypothetical protein M9962_07975 [Oligoflexia bacterium]|nr:hypothetical protein [Oligoflexia bacterium]
MSTLIKPLSLLIALLSVPSTLAEAATPQSIEQYCEAYPNGESSPETKVKILSNVKRSLLVAANKTERRIQDTIDCFRLHKSDSYCVEFRTNLTSLLKHKKESLKILTSLSQHHSRGLMQLSKNAIFNLASNPELDPRAVANFNLYRYTKEEKNHALQLWQRAMIKLLNDDLQEKNAQVEQKSCEDFLFQSASKFQYIINKSAEASVTDMIDQNPMLEILKLKEINDVNIEKALRKLKDYNHKFVDLIEAMRVDHKDTIPSRFILTMQDHEMALVNFPNIALLSIEKMEEKEKANACASWAHLEKQQSQRIKSSIGVGFSTALLCGAGIISGLGTLPTLAACLPSIADSLWGAYRGYNDSKIARLSGVSGREFDIHGEMKEGIRTKEEARELARQANLVVFINLAGIVPVMSSVKTATAGAKGTIKDFAKMPITDSSVSVVEANSGRLTHILKTVRDKSATSMEEMPSYETVSHFQKACHEKIYQK